MGKKNLMYGIVLVFTILVVLTGCQSNTDWDTDDTSIGVYTDSKTCVEYLKYSAGYGKGLSVRYNQDGTIKLNKECLDKD